MTAMAAAINPKLFLAEDIANCKNPLMKNELQCYSFAIAAHRETCSAEASHFASCRLHVHGNREICAARTMDIKAHMATSGGKPASLAQIYHAFKSLHTDTFADFAKAHEVYYATCGKGDMLFLPSGWTFCEKIGNQDVGGVRRFLLSHDHVADAEALSKYLGILGKPSSMLEESVDILNNANQ